MGQLTEQINKQVALICSFPSCAVGGAANVASFTNNARCDSRNKCITKHADSELYN